MLYITYSHFFHKFSFEFFFLKNQKFSKKPLFISNLKMFVKSKKKRDKFISVLTVYKYNLNKINKY